MDCPNCDKKPVGIFHSFRSNGVGFKNRMKGYFRCQHCETMLRQKKGSAIFPEYQKKFWVYYSLYMILALGAILGMFWVFESYNPGTGVIIPVIVLFFVLFLGGADEIRSRSWVIIEATPEEDAKTAEKLTPLGIGVFIVFVLFSAALAIFLTQNIDPDTIGIPTFLAGNILYLVAVMGGAIGILKKFSEKPDKVLSEN